MLQKLLYLLDNKSMYHMHITWQGTKNDDTPTCMLQSNSSCLSILWCDWLPERIILKDVTHPPPSNLGVDFFMLFQHLTKLFPIDLGLPTLLLLWQQKHHKQTKTHKMKGHPNSYSITHTQAVQICYKGYETGNNKATQSTISSLTDTAKSIWNTVHQMLHKMSFVASATFT